MKSSNKKGNFFSGFWKWAKGDCRDPSLYDIILYHFKGKKLIQKIEKQCNVSREMEKELKLISLIEKSMERAAPGSVEYRWAEFKLNRLIKKYNL